MITAEVEPGIRLEFSDISGQKVFSVNNARGSSTVGEVVNEVLAHMQLPRSDASGQPVTYAARSNFEGRHVHSSELVGDSLREGDRLTLQP